MSASRTPTVRPSGGERRGQVDRDRRLADAALAGGDEDDLGRQRDRGLLGALRRRSTGPWPWPCRAARRSSRSSRAAPTVTPGQGADPGPHVVLDLGPERAAGGRERDGDDHGAVGADRGGPGHAEVDDVAAELGVDHAAQHGQHVVGGGQGGRSHAGILPARAGETRSGGRLRIVTEGTSEGSAEPRLAEPRLAVLKALGDNTRYAIYLELARSPRPLATAEIAETLDLHPNTVRPHLERMRDVGLLAVETDARGAVGRPQHRYSLASDAPSLGLEPATFPVLARMLLRVAAAGGLGRDEVVEAGREQGAADAEAPGPGPRPPRRRRRGRRHVRGRPDGPARRAGVRPRAGRGRPRQVTVGFAHCPFRELAEANPEIVCGLHQGLVEGIVDAARRRRRRRVPPAHRPHPVPGRPRSRGLMTTVARPAVSPRSAPRRYSGGVLGNPQEAPVT